MRAKRNSLQFRILVICLITAIATSIMFVVYGGYNVLKYRSDFFRTNSMLVEVYAEELNKDVQELENYIDMLISSDYNYDLLESGRLKNLWQIRAEYYLHNTIKSKAGSMNRSGGVFYFNKNSTHLRSAYSSQYEYIYKYNINVELSDWLQEHAGEDVSAVTTIQGCEYFIRVEGKRNCFVGFFINLTDYFAENVDGEEFQLVFVEKNGEIVEVLGKEIVEEEELPEAINVGIANGFEYVVVKADTVIDMEIYMIRPFWKYLRFWQDIRFWLFLVIVPIIAIVPSAFLYRYFRMLMVIPTDRILNKVRGAKTEESKDAPISDILELQELEEKINTMIQESVKLQGDVYEARMEEARARMQGYLLQIKPHFYLNCLKSLDASLAEGDTERARVFIYQLSNYLRIRFGQVADSHSLESELELVYHYYCLTNLLSVDPLLFVMNAEEADKEIEVPAFCIQTFVENSVKYAKEPNKILKIEIKAQKIEDEGMEYLLIRVADNGKGFGQDQLQRFNSPEFRIKQVEDKHIGINNLIYRIRLLYGEKARCMFYNSVAGGAVVEMMIPYNPMNKEE